MGRRGPTPIPTQIKLLRGNPGHRPIGKREPKPRAGAPSCPAWLGGEAKKMWREIAPQLQEMGVLTKIDRNALTLYCETWARWRLTVEALVGLDYRKDGLEIKRLSIIARDSLGILHRLGAAFGMTPSDRTRIQVAKPSVEDAEFERFLASKPA